MITSKCRNQENIIQWNIQNDKLIMMVSNTKGEVA